jgi:hypothetical protein
MVVSYLKDGWNLTANIYDEINTRNTITKYQTSLHARFTAAMVYRIANRNPECASYDGHNCLWGRL